MSNPVSGVSKRAQTPGHLDTCTLCFSSIPSLASRPCGCPRSRWLRRCVAFRIEDMVASCSEGENMLRCTWRIKKTSWRAKAPRRFSHHATETTSTKIKIERFLKRVQPTTLSPKGKEASQVYHSSRDLQHANLLSPFLVKMPTPKTAPKATKKPTTTRSAIADVVAREYTIHLHKRVRLLT